MAEEEERDGRGGREIWQKRKREMAEEEERDGRGGSEKQERRRREMGEEKEGSGRLRETCLYKVLSQIKFGVSQKKNGVSF